MNNSSWYILKVAPGKERKLCDELNFEVDHHKIGYVKKFVCPLEKEVTQNKTKNTIRDKVIYPGYLYFESDADITNDTLKSISQYEGVMSLMGDKTPIKLRDKDVIRILMDDNLEIHQGEKDKLFNVGDEVTIINGPFKTFRGIVQGTNDDVIEVEVKIFGRTNLIELKIFEIERYFGG